MTWRSFFEGLGDFFQWTFKLIEGVGMAGNYFFMAVMTILGVYWISQMIGHQRKGEH